MRWKIFIILPQFLWYAALLQPYAACAEKSRDGETTTSIPGSDSPIPCFEEIDPRAVLCDHRHLKSIPKNLRADIQTLYLDSNDIPALYNNSFRRYPLLSVIYLDSNDISFIETGALYPLKHLNGLQMRYNKNLVVIQSEVFRWSAELTALLLEFNNIQLFPNDALQWLPRLEQLALRANPLHTINFTLCRNTTFELVVLRHIGIEVLTNETFIFKCKCKELLLDNNSLTFIDPQVIASLPVKFLSIGTPNKTITSAFTTRVCSDLMKGIARSSIEKISFYSFYDCNIYNALYLLGNKQISKIELIEYMKIGRNFTKCMNQLQKMPQVIIFSIKSSYIGVLRPEYFNGLTMTQELILNNNGIIDIDVSLSQWNINLYRLDLSYNNLLHLHSSAFRGLENLKQLFLVNNLRLTSIPLSLPNLEVLIVTGTALSGNREPLPRSLLQLSFESRLFQEYGVTGFFSSDRFKGLTLLQAVVLGSSRIKLGEIWYPSSTRKSVFEGLSSLRYLDLHINDIRSLPGGLFSDLIRLKDLFLSRCRISNIEKNVFAGLSSLINLHLQENEIIQLPSDLFLYTRKLLSVYIQMNHLGYLDDDLFSHTTNLTNLTIAGNELISLNLSTFKPVQSSLEFIDFSENPIECSCELDWVVRWLTESDSLHELNVTTCIIRLAKKVHKDPIRTLDISKFCTTYLPLYCSLPFVAATLMAIIVVGVHKKWYFRYKVFLLKLAVVGYREIRDTREHVDYQFDLSIMFTGHDQTWAAEYLRPMLKEQLPQFQRIAFGDDDLPLGMYYLDAVLFLIEHSFKTILVLSKAATRDHDFMMKLRIALNHMTTTNTQSTTLIFVEDIPEEEMPYLVRLYLGEHMSYMKFPDDERRQAFFWKQLVKRLKVNLRFNDMVPPE